MCNLGKARQGKYEIPNRENAWQCESEKSERQLAYEFQRELSNEESALKLASLWSMHY
jgi:hypothetical protein